MSLLELKNLCYVHHNDLILENISLSINSGDFVSLVGPSGGGKSTLFKICSHLISPTSGTILYKNKPFIEYNPVELRKNISYCFQTPQLFRDTVMDNLNFPYAIRNMKADLNRIEKLLHTFSLDKNYLNKSIENLSGGEKQRIALIRTLIFKPEILLLDEVTSALDVENTLIVEDVIEALNKDDITILWITHNPEQSVKFANKVVTIESGRIKSVEVIR
ncbi:ATP-binding cassette domain-containing protein [Clostridium sp. A1-XYC3]|uniref:ATP-binding cassette domain-containing protein n=1 Tax=Clostridium tanneri TaxID=3037988 RepID=A0ABU4JVH4_9CLOT|nr:ATP-binding cassette domain-containing protein [Clostridium sp. A1-XYC3]MDW8802147.1 ATP-binding cassette domain-containing protein [Clostridium sp. A1-XYC3]